MRRGPKRALRALLLGAAVAAAPAIADAPLFGRTITELSFAGDAKVDEAELAKLTDLRPGQRLTEAAVRSAMRNLFATRRFSDLSVEAAAAGEGIRVRVTFAAAPVIASVEVKGARLLERGRLRDALSIEPGETWSPEKGDAAERGVKRVLLERGYFEARLASRIDPGPDDVSVALSFHVEQGPLARAATPIFSGSTAPFGAGELAKVVKLKPGKAFRQARAREDAERLTAWLHRRGYARAEVRSEGEIYERGTARARYAVFVGPEVVLSVTGASVSSVKGHPESPWSRGEPPDEEAVRKLREALLRGYQENGYAHAEVDAALRTEPSVDRIVVAIRKGPRFAVDRVGFSGVHSIPAKELAGALKTRPRGLMTTGRLVDRDLDEDRKTLEGLYASRGFPDVRTRKPDVAPAGGPFTLAVGFPVEEGAPVVVGERRVEGNIHAAESTLLPLLSVVPGQPYSRARAAADEATLQGWYLSHGWPEASVNAETKLLPPVPPRPLSATVVYKVSEGDAVVFGKTVVRGNTRTKTSVVAHEFAHDEGEPFVLGRLIDTQQALTRLGVFSRIDVSYFPTDPETRSRTVLVTLAEAKRWSFLYGIGAEYDPHAERRFNPRFSLGVTYANLFGRALVASVEGRWSVRDKRLVGTLRDPTLFGAKIPVSFTIFRADQRLENFSVARRGAFLEGEHRFSPKLKATLRYQYEIVNPDAAPEILTNLERQNQAEAISSIGPGLVYDTRNDPVDPHTGILASLDTKYAFSFLDANARFLKGLAQAAVYRPISGTVLAVSVRAGAIQSYGTCDTAANPTCPPNLEIPIVERFFAGGRTTHRAFPLDDLGTLGDTIVIREDGSRAVQGGNGLLIGNLEWRIPVFGDLGVSLFLDTGNVWSDWRKIRISELRTGAGLGLHYLTPVGPLRLEYGWKLDRKTGESAGEASFSVGYPF